MIIQTVSLKKINISCSYILQVTAKKETSEHQVSLKAPPATDSAAVDTLNWEAKFPFPLCVCIMYYGSVTGLRSCSDWSVLPTEIVHTFEICDLCQVIKCDICHVATTCRGNNIPFFRLDMLYLQVEVFIQHLCHVSTAWNSKELIQQRRALPTMQWKAALDSFRAFSVLQRVYSSFTSVFPLFWQLLAKTTAVYKWSVIMLSIYFKVLLAFCSFLYCCCSVIVEVCVCVCMRARIRCYCET